MIRRALLVAGILAIGLASFASTASAHNAAFTVTCSPETPAIGATVTISGTGFHPGTSYELYGNDPTQPFGGQWHQFAKADANGDISSPRTDVPPGKTYVFVLNARRSASVGYCHWTAS